jgi:hypothetical protein
VSPTIEQLAPAASQRRTSYQVAPEAASHSTHSAHAQATPCRFVLQAGPDKSKSGGAGHDCARSDVGAPPTTKIKMNKARRCRWGFVMGVG